MVSTSTCMLSTSAVWWSTMEVCVSVQTQSPQRSSRWSLSPWTRSVVPPRAASCACRELAKSYTLFTPPRQTSQYCLVLSVSVVWTILQTRQDSFVLSQPDFPFATEIYWGLLKTRKLETGSRQDKTVLSCLHLCSHCGHGQGKTVLSCSCWRCEQAVTDAASVCCHFIIYVKQTAVVWSYTGESIWMTVFGNE